MGQVELLDQAPRSEAAAVPKPPPEELNFKNDPEFVAACAERLRKSKGLRTRTKQEAATLRATLSSVVEEPNTCLSYWVEFIDLHVVKHTEAQAVDPALAAQLALPSGGVCSCCDKCFPVSRQAFMILHVPIIQMGILFALLQYQWNEEIDWEGGETMCRAVDGDSSSTADMTYDITLFYLGISELRSMQYEWQVMSFLASLRPNPGANFLLYVCYTIAQGCEMLYALNLYLLLMHTPDLLDCLLNCLALTFVMELDNMKMKLYPRLQGAAAQTLAELSDGAEYTDFVLFAAAPRVRWAPWGLHYLGVNAGSALARYAGVLVRNALLLVSGVLYYANKLLPWALLTSFAMCSTTSRDIVSAWDNPGWNIMASVTNNGTKIASDVPVSTLHRTWTNFATNFFSWELKDFDVAGPLVEQYPPAPPAWFASS